MGPGWSIETAEGHHQLARAYRFPDFAAAMAFANRVAGIAEAEGHHPDLLVGWGRVEVRLWTHVAGGLTDNDFILAARLGAAARPLPFGGPEGPPT